MQSKINPSEWWQDKNAKSLSYFSIKSPVIINKTLIENLKELSKNNGNVNARFCLHSNPNETLHDMVILEYQDKKCRKPHKHLTKDETLHMIEGEMIALTFNDDGGLIDKTILDKNNFAYRTFREQHHIWIPLSKYIIYREIKQGPFQQEDNISANFDYIKILKNYVDMDLTCHNPGCKTPCSLSNRLKNK